MAVPELILGAMPEGADPGDHWAAGVWCFAGQEQNFPHWEEKFILAPEPLRDSGLLATAAKGAQTLAVRQMPAVAKMLCPEMERFPAVYWQVLLAPFMVEVASQIVERALRAQAMLRVWGAQPLQVSLLPENCAFDFADEHDVTLRGSLGLEFNHWLLSRMLEWQLPSCWQAHYLEPYALPPLAPSREGLAAKFKNLLRQWATSLPFPRLKGLNLADAVSFSLLLRGPCRGDYQPLDLERDFDFTSCLEQIPLPEGVERIFARALPRSLKTLKHKPLGRQSKKPRLRIAPTAAGEQAHLRQKLARWRACGNALAHCQHGGIYGQVATPCVAELVEYSQSIFFTWGWKSQGKARGNFLPLPAPMLSTLPRYRRKADSTSLVFVGTEMSVYGRRLDSHPTPLQYVAYRRAKRDFLAALPQEMRARTLYRPYFPLPGTLADATWLLPQFPEAGLCAGPLQPQLLNCRLLALDHPGTTMLEALAMGVPFVAYWDRQAWPWVPEAAPLLDELAACGIWHSTPEGAARQAAQVWADPLAWWLDANVARAREEFSRSQAWRAEDFRSMWVNILEVL